MAPRIYQPKRWNPPRIQCSKINPEALALENAQYFTESRDAARRPQERQIRSMRRKAVSTLFRGVYLQRLMQARYPGSGFLAAGLLPDHADNRQEKRHQYQNDRDDDQQFDERESVP